MDYHDNLYYDDELYANSTFISYTQERKNKMKEIGPIFKCEELNKLVNLLGVYSIEFENETDGIGSYLPFNVPLIERIHFKYNGQLYSAINGVGTYGGAVALGCVNHGLIELMNLSTGEEPIGNLKAYEVLDIIFGG